MAKRLPEGAALLFAGYGSVGPPGFGASVLQTIGQIGETLLATATTWRIRRLSPTTGERYTPDRASLKRHLIELTQQPVEVALLAGAGVITVSLGEPALVAGSRHREYPEDATLPLSWIRERLRSCRAGSVLVVLSAQSDDRAGEAAAWLDALRTDQPNHVIAVHSSGSGSEAMDALLGGLCGDAVDPRTGTITARSISEHLARQVAGIAMQPSAAPETLAGSPPLGGLWDLRLSQQLVSRRAMARARAPAAPEDLIHVILPGRFRIERVLAKGSFGTVYRARQLSVERDVAIKVLHAGIDPASEDGRLFIQEIQGVGRLDHSNVVRIYQADITPDGRLFFAMELLVGRDLQHIITEDGPLARDRAIELAQQLLVGLGAAHDAGLVHADVKPANAFVVRRGDRERLVLLDFGLARLRRPGGPAESAGGTPAYMAPEQLHDGRVDARSDLFSAGLVLVTLLTGWRRGSAEELVPPLGDIADPELRSVLERALAVDPARRFQTAADFIDALQGKTHRRSQQIAARPPFRHLAAMTERDRGRLHGRERDVAALTEHVLYRRAVIYTAPSGTGKTSLLRAGLVPRLEALGVRPVYVSCRAGAAAALAADIWPGAATVAAAIRDWHRQRGGKLVMILDQLEVVLSEALPMDPADPRQPSTETIVNEALAFDSWPADADVSVVLSVREDFLARLIGGSQRLEEGIPVVRLGPLGPAGAREAISGPLTEARLSIEPELLDVLLADLQAAATAIGPEIGWGPIAAIYPPHLQLTCSVLCDALPPGEAVLTLAHYRKLGGLDAIVGEYLDRVLDTELDAEAVAVARDLFLALVTSAHTRAMRTEGDLVDIVGGRHGADRVRRVLEVLHARGLIVRLRAGGGEPAWELIHDSLVPRVLGWVDRRDLARRRAIELVRHHLRRSRPGAPSLLNRAELRELRANPEAVSELEAEWARRRSEQPLTPAVLVSASHRLLRRRALLLAGAGVVALGIAAVPAQRWMAEREIRRQEQALRDLDMGRFALELVPFDWDVDRLEPIPVPVDALPNLHWELHEPDPEDPDSPGQPLAGPRVVRGRPALAPDHSSRIERIEARGGKTFLVVGGRGRGSEECSPSIVPLRQLPGYAQRDRPERVLRVRVPTCQTTRADARIIPAGKFVHGGLGEPPSKYVAGEEGGAIEEVTSLPAFGIDRTEVTNAAFAVYAEMEGVTDISMPPYTQTKMLRSASAPRFPVSGVTWVEARAYCRFLGKELPTNEQWEKAMRGGLVLPGGLQNPMPRRNLPWGEPTTPVPAKLVDTGEPGPAPVGTFPGDVSPYGVVDMAGNVQEWTDSVKPITAKRSRTRITRGANWGDANAASLVDYMALPNLRPTDTRNFAMGIRCAVREM